MDDAGWIGRFIRHLEYERRLSPLTGKNYRRDLERLVEYLDKAGVAEIGAAIRFLSHRDLVGRPTRATPVPGNARLTRPCPSAPMP